MEVKTVVFYDWDDTLFPTTPCIEDGLILQCGLKGWSVDNIKNEKCIDIDGYKQIGNIIYEILSNYINVYGASNIIIITNGGRNWPQISLKHIASILNLKIYLDILSLFETSNITILSGRYLFATKYKNVNDWKLNTFKLILSKILDLTQNKQYLKFITIGDKLTDHQSLTKCIQQKIFEKIVKNKNLFIQHKIYKFDKTPNLNQYYQQILSFSHIVPSNEYITTKYFKTIKRKSQCNKSKCYFTNK